MSNHLNKDGRKYKQLCHRILIGGFSTTIRTTNIFNFHKTGNAHTNTLFCGIPWAGVGSLNLI